MGEIYGLRVCKRRQWYVIEARKKVETGLAACIFLEADF
jgi:hypothetical protein